MEVRKLNQEKGSVLLFSIIALAVLTIVFATLISVTTNRLTATKKAADVNDYQTYIENLGNYYAGEVHYVQEIAALAVDYYMKAGYYNVSFPSEFTVELYEGAQYNSVLRAIISTADQSQYQANTMGIDDKALLQTRLLDIARDIYKKAILYVTDTSVLSGGSGLPQEEARYVNRIEKWRQEHNEELVIRYGLPAGSEPIKTTIRTEPHGNTGILLTVHNEIDLQIEENLFTGVTRYTHDYEVVLNYSPHIEVKEIPGMEWQFEVNVIEAPADLQTIRWKVTPIRTT